MKRLLLSTAVIATLWSAALAQTAGNVTVKSMSGGYRMDNGLVTINIAQNGRVTLLKGAGAKFNMLSSNGVYFDYTAAANTSLSPDKAEIIKQTDDYGEVLFSNTKSNPMISQGYIVRKGVDGFYTYIIVRGNSANGAAQAIREARVCVRTQGNYLNGYVDETMQGKIPSTSEMSVAEQAENTVQDATYKLADGSIYTKYNWANYVVNDDVHGLMSNTNGVWNIACSHEWLNGGPMRQELTVHATSKSPISIQMLQGEHFGASAQTFGDDDVKIYGPFFIYCNAGATTDEMIADAKAMAARQKAEWPFQWFENELYPLDRATVKGKIMIPNGHSEDKIQVVLCEPGSSPYTQGKKYIYWGLTDQWGSFEIPDVRRGDYAIYAYATQGSNTDVLQVSDIKVNDAVVDLGQIDWSPARYEHLLALVGDNNRRSDGFRLSDAPRAYGHWTDVPANLTFTCGESKEAEDWYFAQCQNGAWDIVFNNDKTLTGDLHFTASVAGSTNKPTVEVQLNGTTVKRFSFSNDAGIYRSARQGGRHSVIEATVPAENLVLGQNKLTLKMSGIGRNGGVMWDCIKLEGGEPVKELAGIEDVAVEGAVTDAPFEIYTIEGVRVATVDTLDEASLAPGLYIYRQGRRSGKFLRR